MVKVRMHYAAINPSDLMFVQGRYGIRPQLPSGAGFEGMGTIVEVGPNVDLPVGLRVCLTGIGVWAETVLTSSQQVFPLPADVSDEMGAQLFVNPVTAYAMVEESGLGAGEWLLLTAAASAFSKAVLFFAAQKGLKVIGTVRRDDFRDELLRLGASAIINTSTENLLRKVQEYTDGKGVGVALEAIAGPDGAAVLPCLRRDGKMLVYGALSLEEMPVNVGLLIFKGLSIQGFWLTSWLQRHGAAGFIRAFQGVLELVRQQPELLPIEQIYPLAEFKAALTQAQQTGRFGKILLRLPGAPD